MYEVNNEELNNEVEVNEVEEELEPETENEGNGAAVVIGGLAIVGAAALTAGVGYGIYKGVMWIVNKVKANKAAKAGVYQAEYTDTETAEDDN